MAALKAGLAALSEELTRMQRLKRNWYELLYLGLFVLYLMSR